MCMRVTKRGAPGVGRGLGRGLEGSAGCSKRGKCVLWVGATRCISRIEGLQEQYCIPFI